MRDWMGVDVGTDNDANGCSLHSSTCGWLGVTIQLFSKLSFSQLACMHDRLEGNMIPKSASHLHFQMA